MRTQIIRLCWGERQRLSRLESLCRWPSGKSLSRELHVFGASLTPGKHMVRFAYEPASFVTGAVQFFGIGLLCLAAFVLWSLRRSRIAEPHLAH